MICRSPAPTTWVGSVAVLLAGLVSAGLIMVTVLFLGVPVRPVIVVLSGWTIIARLPSAVPPPAKVGVVLTQVICWPA